MSRLEAAVERFVEQSSMAIAAIHEDVAEIRVSNARTDRELLRLRQESEKRWEESNQRWEEWKQQAEKDRQESAKSREESNQRWEEFKQQADKDRQQADKDRQQAEQDRRDFNKRMAEISDRVGRFIEDMVHPNAARIAGKLFGGDPIETLAIRVKRKHPADASRMLELDLLVAGTKHLLIGEAQSTPTVEKAKDLLAKASAVPEFFPEYAGHKILPLLASVSFDPSLLAYLTRRRIHALGFGDETMELLNEGAF